MKICKKSKNHTEFI